MGIVYVTTCHLALLQAYVVLKIVCAIWQLFAQEENHFKPCL